MTKLEDFKEEGNELGWNLPPETIRSTRQLVFEPCAKCDSCNSNICPHIYGSGDAWSPEEGACQHPAFADEQWVKTQKKIAKRARDKYSMYTFEMLNRNFIVTAATIGLDPDKCEVGYEKSAKRWIENHPEIKELTFEEKEKKRLAVAIAREGITRSEKRQSA